ncbi:serine hydrolase [Edwardsiella tarda]|uniref:serine hydrolase n=1 Tax=Edwardsiella tarda TaxID=636 RepID=UPI000BE2A046|nr:serine hydrolase [Edwardsiella tarda]ATI63433.1 serine-type D-Ala-D-Ala carboxypeptidase [Edwardsiella tarda]
MNTAAKIPLALLFLAGAAQAQSAFPLVPPHIDAASWVLMDAQTGQILAQGNPDARRNPASLTKLMTNYVVERALDQGRIGLNDPVPIGNDAWATRNPSFKGSSLMFLKPGDKATVSDLIRGIIIDSGNDACVALADYVSGDQAGFVRLMNGYVQQLHLQNTHFETVHGLDAPGQYSSARDLAQLTRAIILHEQPYYHFYAQKSLSWNGVTQNNRNGLLWDQDLHVDGMKTGHTASAGFNLVASSIDPHGQRLIAVVMGADSSRGREVQAKKLLQWGERNFETVQLVARDRAITSQQVWYGQQKTVALGNPQNIYYTLPKGELRDVKVDYTLNHDYLEAPLARGQVVGRVNYLYDGKSIGSYDLRTLAPVAEAGWFSRLEDYIAIKIG